MMQLHYFPIRGLGEMIRVLLAFNETECAAHLISADCSARDMPCRPVWSTPGQPNACYAANMLDCALQMGRRTCGLCTNEGGHGLVSFCTVSQVSPPCILFCNLRSHDGHASKSSVHSLQYPFAYCSN
jgi:hypothetical protein